MEYGSTIAFGFPGNIKKDKSHSISIIKKTSPALNPSLISCSLNSLIYKIPKKPVTTMIVIGIERLIYGSESISRKGAIIELIMHINSHERNP